jgi:DNA polymerase alpha-associated DNA helicase A
MHCADHYRMNERIADFPSKTLYNGELVSAPSVAKHTLLDLPTVTASDESKDDLEQTVVFFDTAGCEFYERAEDTESKARIGEGSKSNENEATIVAKWARKLVACGVPSAEVGIVAPYQAQVALLSSLLHEEFPDMTIGTVDGLQGQERDVSYIDACRANGRQSSSHSCGPMQQARSASWASIDAST